MSELAPIRVRHIREPYPGGQSYHDVVAQTRDFLNDVARHEDGQRILLIAPSACRSPGRKAGTTPCPPRGPAGDTLHPGADAGRRVLPTSGTPDPRCRRARPAAQRRATGPRLGRARLRHAPLHRPRLGPQLLLFLHPDDRARHGQRLHDLLAQHLPTTFAGYPTNFVPAGARVQSMTPVEHPPVNHRVVITDLLLWTDGWLGFDPQRAVSLLDWLATPTQRLAETTGGAAFHDGLGQLAPMRRALDWYPDDVWRYVLACQWQRIAEEEDEAGKVIFSFTLVGSGAPWPPRDHP